MGPRAISELGGPRVAPGWTAGRAGVDRESGRSEWDEVAARIVPSVQGKTLKTRPEGVIVTVEITSALKTVGGTSPGGSGFGATVASVAGAITDPLGTIANASVTKQRVVAARIVDVRPL